jgi:spermidine synthase
LLSLTETLSQGNHLMTESLLKNNNIIFFEMMTHPVLFTHPQPKIVGILGDDDNGILCEVLKHSSLTEIHQIKENHPTQLVDDPRIILHEHHHWMKECKSHPLDILITLTEPAPDLLQQYFHLLKDDGLLIQISTSPFEPEPLKSLITQLKITGFHDLHILHFPEPPSGWRTATIALKNGVFKRLREKAIYNKSFKTHYYNFDIHRASMVLPEFMRETII